ncbi:MAG TPA: oligosaccharide flippase family protein [Staphylococcus sp.]|nr:oligosaccharide flippase family protein [Staphylococcus sp.]
MKTLILNVLKKKFVRNVIMIVAGTAGAQAIAMIMSPIITRMYGPEAFGMMGTFSSIINILVPIAALAYPIAIVLPKRDINAKKIIELSLIITVFNAILSLIILLFFNNSIVNLFNLKEISNYMFLIPLVILFGGFMQVSEQWLIRTKQFSINAKVTILQSAITNGSKVGIGFFYPVAAVLVVITAMANGLKATLMAILSKKSSYKEVENNVDEELKTTKQLAKEHYDFPMYRAPEMFLNATSNGLPVLMLSTFFGPAAAGFYSIGKTVLRLPAELIGKSVGDVFYPRIAEAANNKENLPLLIKKATLALAGVGILPYGLIIIFGPTIFSLVFGSDWAVAGEYARWIAIWSYVGFMNRPSVRSLPVLSAQRFHLIYTIIMLITRVLALAIGYYIFHSDLIAVALFGISGAILNFGLITITLRIAKRYR